MKQQNAVLLLLLLLHTFLVMYTGAQIRRYAKFHTSWSYTMSLESPQFHDLLWDAFGFPPTRKDAQRSGPPRRVTALCLCCSQQARVIGAHQSQ